MRGKFNKASLYVISGFYILAGFNHFIDPIFYFPLIPPAFPQPELINILSGIAEVTLGIGFFSPKTRKFSAFGVIALLIAFIPSHVYFIQIGGCVENGLCVPEWIGWIRLIVIHPLLILWAYSVSKTNAQLLDLKKPIPQ